MATFRLTQQAADDIAAIGRYTIAHFGVEQARIYHDGMQKAFAFLIANPKAARERSEISPPVRAYRYQAHLIVYEIAVDGDIIILRVPYARSDWINEGAGV